MNKTIYYTTTALIVSCGITQAQTCVPTPTCSTLGYTSSSSCTNGIKCPFGEAWYCPSGSSQEISNLCLEMGYKYPCTGTGYAGGDWSCNGKYQKCTCAIGYRWENNTCKQHAVFGQCLGYAKQCSLGDILFSDGTCSANKISGKTPIAVVVYKSGNCGQALALKSIGDYEWGPTSNDISGLTNYTSASSASKDYDSCGNSKKIMAAGNKSKYPAVWAANEYSTEGTSAGDWCLPAAGIFTSYYNNQSVINTGFSRAGGTKFTTSTEAWSSSEYDKTWAWYSNFSGSYGLDYGGKTYANSSSYDVRPVIEF